MKKLLASVLCAVLALGMQPMTAFAKAPAQQTGSIAGTATDANKAAMSGVRVQLRNVDTGALSGTTTSGANGAFSFTGLPAGNYVIEIVDATGKIIGTSAAIAVAAGAVITGVTLSASAGAGLAAAAAAGGAGAFFTSTAGILVLAGTGLAVGGIIAATNDSSPSQ